MGFIKIAGAALNQTPIDWANNTNNIIEAITQAKNAQVNILCLPELCITAYGCEDLFLTQWVAAEALEQLLLIKKHCTNIAVAVGFPLFFEEKLYNCTAFIDNSEIKGIYAKQFLANEGVHYETRWFTAWPAGKVSEITIHGTTYPLGELLFKYKETRIGFEICEDAWVADTIRPACRHVKKGIDLILNPSASHFSFHKSDIRYNLISGSSKSFNCTYLYTNLLGNEAGKIIYDGEVLIYNKGNLIQRNERFSFKAVNLVSAEIDFQTDTHKESPLSPDSREKEYEFWEATCLGLFDYMRKSYSKGFILSLSGGADSSACAVMVYEMVKKGITELGLESFVQKAGLADKFNIDDFKNKSIDEQCRGLLKTLLVTAYQSTRNSGEETLQSAKRLAESLGATFYHWSVDAEMNAYLQTIEKNIGRELSWDTDDLALQNIQARSRAPIIWILANIHNSLLITTSNRSEGDVGYATMDGDMAGSIAPIAGVDKDFIRKWLLWAERELAQKGLAPVNALTPTAELRPAQRVQTDEKDLMPYSILAKIERQAIKERKSPLLVYEYLSKDLADEPNLKNYIVKFFRMWAKNQWKRERTAPSFHLDDFNIDPRSWCRFPILSGAFKKELEILEK